MISPKYLKLINSQNNAKNLLSAKDKEYDNVLQISNLKCKGIEGEQFIMNVFKKYFEDISKYSI